MPIRAISFDLFDTLVDLLSEEIPKEDYRGRAIPRVLGELHRLVCAKVPIEFDAYLQAMKEADAVFRESHYARDRELPSFERFEAHLGRLGIDDVELVHALVSTHMGRLRDQVRFLDHHPAVLAELGERCRLGVCSNFSHSETAHGVLDDAGLTDLMDAVLISDAVGIRKPARQIFEATLDALGVEPHELLHVGDRLRADVAGAAALGIRTVWIVRRVSDPAAALAREPATPPDFQISDLAELPEVLGRASEMA